MSMSDPFLPASASDDQPEVPDVHERQIDTERNLDDEVEVEDDADLEDDDVDDDEEFHFSTRKNFFRPPTPGDRVSTEQLEEELDAE